MNTKPSIPRFIEPISRQLIYSYLGELDLSLDQKKNHRCAIEAFECYLLSEGVELHEFDREEALRYKEWLSENYSQTTAQSYARVIRLFIAWSAKKNLCHDVSREIRVSRSSGPKISLLEYDEALAVLGYANRHCVTLSGKRNFAIINLMLRCSLRPSQIHEANVGDLAFESDGQCFITVRGWSKQSKEQVIPLDSDSLRALTDYLEARNHPYKTEPLFTSCSSRTMGRRLSVRSIREAMKEALNNAGIRREKASAYSLRMSSMLFALEGGASISEVCKFATERNIAYKTINPGGFFDEDESSIDKQQPTTTLAQDGLSFLINKQELQLMTDCFHLTDWLVISIDKNGDFSIELAD